MASLASICKEEKNVTVVPTQPFNVFLALIEGLILKLKPRVTDLCDSNRCIVTIEWNEGHLATLKLKSYMFSARASLYNIEMETESW